MNLGQGDDVIDMPLALDTPKLPIEITVFPNGKDGYTIGLSYDTALYSRQDMEIFAHAIANYALHATKDSIGLKDIELITEDEQTALIRLGTGKHIDIDINETFVSAFERQAAKTPVRIAVTDGIGHLTYAELSQCSNLLAHHLTEAGVQPDSFVCVLLDRVKEFPLSVIGIMKAGGAYVPLDTEYPAERLRYILEDSEAKVLITSHDLLEEKQALGMDLPEGLRVIFIDDVDFSEKSEAINLSTADGLAYMIYTSGSSFDAHVKDMYAILTVGGSMHIMPSEIRKDLDLMFRFIEEHNITGGGYTTPIAALMLRRFPQMDVRFVAAGGEKLSNVYSDHIEIINEYGPTECTVDATFYTIAPKRHLEEIPIGKTVANCYTFIIIMCSTLW